MKNLLVCVCLVLFSHCTTTEKAKNPETLMDSGSIENTGAEEIVTLTLEDTIRQIRKWFNIINSNATAHNYNTTHFRISTDSTLIEVVEYTNKNENERQKVIYKSNTGKYDLPLNTAYDHVSQITREYYYWREKKFFIYETIKLLDKDSLPYQLENRYYFEGDDMIRWICDKKQINKEDSLYKIVESVLSKESNTLLYPFDYFKDYPTEQSQIRAARKEELFDTYYQILSFRHQSNDSINVIFKTFHDRYLFEVYNTNTIDSTSRSSLYLLAIDEINGQWEADELIIGTSSLRTTVETPGDFFYYLMNLSKAKDIKSLREVIPKEGYRTNVAVAIGDVDKPQYEHDWTISRDTIEFGDLGFDFSPSIFNFHVTIDEQFDENGYASISYWGGGFGEAVHIRKTEGGVYLVSHSSRDH